MPEEYSLIVCEKPNAARKIAESLAEGGVSVEKRGKVSYFEIARGGRKLIVVSAVGHLYGLVEANKGKWTYPVLDTKWAPVWESNKTADFAKPYLQVIEDLAKGASDFYNATDYDVEGAVIGFNVLRFACGAKDGRRMKFSTLTSKELVGSYEKASAHLDFPQVEAGLARHEMDWLYGINLSRALSIALKKAGRWQVLSTGRVQGPALAILAAREREIGAFKPTPFWQIELLTHKHDTPVNALHVEDKFWDRGKADAVLAKTSGAKDCSVKSLERKRYAQPVPTPFDLTKLQTEAYRHFGYAPNMTQKIAQSLYEKALISYPRTSSQKLPERLGLREILISLSKQKKYEDLAGKLASMGALKPNEGDKDDPAHPAIYPTGEKPKALTDQQARLYDLVVRRFLSVFGDPATRESVTVVFDVRGELFSAAGHSTVERGWMEYYSPYAKFDEDALPQFREGERLPVDAINLLSKETEPPARFNEASLVKKLEEENLGTKATRADIIQTLYSRGYIKEKKIVVTDLGMAVIDSLEKSAPRILSAEMTRELEGKMDGIIEGKEKREDVVARAKDFLVKVLEDFRKDEAGIGKVLLAGLQITQRERETLGPCNKCGKGVLKVVFNPRTRKRFCGCSQYPECKNAFPLPYALIEPTGKVCDKCSTPIIKVIRAGKRPFTMCLDPACPTKADWGEKKGAAGKENSEENKENGTEASQFPVPRAS